MATKKDIQKTTKTKRFGKWLTKNWWKVFIVILLLVGGGLFAKEYLNTKQELKDLQNPVTAGGTELQSIVGAVGKLGDIPQNETPTLYTVSDKTKLGNEIFFKDAENGDRLLFFPSSRKLVLYRPSTDRIIGLTVLNISSDGTKQTPAEGATQAPAQ